MKYYILLIFLFSSFVFSQETIHINMRHTEIVNADQLILEVHSELNGNNLDSLYNILHSKSLKILSTLKSFGFSEEQIHFFDSNLGSTGYNSEYKYNAQQVYRLILTDFKIFDTLRSELIKKGAEKIRIVEFTNSNYEETVKLAYKTAIKKAEQKAKLIIGKETIKIKDIVDNTESPLNFSGLNKLTFKPQEMKFVNYYDGPDIETKESTLNNVKISIPIILRIEFVAE